MATMVERIDLQLVYGTGNGSYSFSESFKLIFIIVAMFFLNVDCIILLIPTKCYFVLFVVKINQSPVIFVSVIVF